MKNVVTLGLAGLLGIGIATSASATEPQFYGAAGVGYSSYDLPSTAPAGSGDDSWGYSILAGAEFQTGHNGVTVAVEGGWKDFGDIDGGTGSPDTEIDGWFAGIKAALPVSADGATRVFARGGQLWWEGTTGPVSVDQEDWYYGGGIDHLVSPNIRVGLDLEFISLDPGAGSQDIDTLSTTARVIYMF
ncbi:MAG: outer membrane beta-barrel protein [Alphaproteobacteria bacterium]